MNQHRPPELDMTLDGRFVDSPRWDPRSAPGQPPAPPLLPRIMLWLIVVAVLAGALAIAAFVLWFALMALPVALGAGAVAYGIYRFQAWRARQSLGRQSFGGQRNLWRP